MYTYVGKIANDLKSIPTDRETRTHTYIYCCTAHKTSGKRISTLLEKYQETIKKKRKKKEAKIRGNVFIGVWSEAQNILYIIIYVVVLFTAVFS